jgi:hypothetical protein
MDAQHRRSKHDLLAVYADPGGARVAAARLRDAGIASNAIAAAEPRDHDLSLRAEMRDELTSSWISPQASFIMTKEGTRGFVVLLVMLNAVAVAVATPFAFIEFGGLAFWGRWLIVVGSVVAMVSVIALVVGPALGSRRPDDPLAAHRGITLRVAADGDDVVEILKASGPIRIDAVTRDNRPLGPIATEEDHGQPSSLADEAARAAGDLATNVSTDDVHPADPTGVAPPV